MIVLLVACTREPLIKETLLGDWKEEKSGIVFRFHDGGWVSLPESESRLEPGNEVGPIALVPIIAISFQIDEDERVLTFDQCLPKEINEVRTGTEKTKGIFKIELLEDTLTLEAKQSVRILKRLSM